MIGLNFGMALDCLKALLRLLGDPEHKNPLLSKNFNVQEHK